MTDTSPDIRDAYFRRLAEMSPAERVRVGVGLWDAANRLQRATILRKTPGASEEEIAFQIAVSRFGPELARAAWRRKQIAS